MSTEEELETAKREALRDPAWQGAPPENITFEEFRDVLTEELWRWLPKSRPLSLASWWLYVKQFSAREFNKAYDQEYPRRCEK